MATTLDLETPNGQVRALIGDLDKTRPIFPFSSGSGTSDAVDVYISLAKNKNVKRAAASALRAIASSEALLRKKVQLMEASVDATAVASELRRLADSLEKEANRDEGVDPQKAPTTLIFEVIG